MSFGRLIAWVLVVILVLMPINWLRLGVAGELPKSSSISELLIGAVVCWLIAGGLGFFLVVSARGLKKLKARDGGGSQSIGEVTQMRGATHGRVQRDPTRHWPSLGEFDFEVVGESNYQKAIARIAGRSDENGVEHECVAELVPEHDNPYDPKAVAVRIDGQTVGYLSREDARSFRRRLGAKGLSGETTTCDALVRGGGQRKDGTKLFYGVWLDLKPFE
jgi:hypothetical protein